MLSGYKDQIAAPEKILLASNRSAQIDLRPDGANSGDPARELGSAKVDLNETPYSIYVSDAPLNLVLGILGRDLGLEFSVDGSQRRRVRDLRLSGSSDDVLEDLLREVSMEAFQFNGQVFVSAEDERQVRLVRLNDVSSVRAMAALADAGLVLPEFDIREVAQGKALVMSGPVKYLAISESLIASLASVEADPEPTVRVRRGGRLEPQTQRSIGSVASAAE